ncbi:hypothetical protein [Bradyrhizobium ottawaense]|uniref:hypothetical protein n=1 Tax=Bradyrhizobium ottawaense TaxID=931866 RepID=UPI00384AC68E
MNLAKLLVGRVLRVCAGRGGDRSKGGESEKRDAFQGERAHGPLRFRLEKMDSEGAKKSLSAEIHRAENSLRKGFAHLRQVSIGGNDVVREERLSEFILLQAKYPEGKRSHAKPLKCKTDGAM